MWIKNPGTDKRDTMLTLAIIGFVVVLIKTILSGVEINGVTFGTIDSGMIAAILTPTLGAYVARRYTDKIKDNPK